MGDDYDGAAYRALNAVFFWQDDHCRDSWLADVAWAKEILEFEE